MAEPSGDPLLNGIFDKPVNAVVLVVLVVLVAAARLFGSSLASSRLRVFAVKGS